MAELLGKSDTRAGVGDRERHPVSSEVNLAPSFCHDAPGEEFVGHGREGALTL